MPEVTDCSPVSRHRADTQLVKHNPAAHEPRPWGALIPSILILLFAVPYTIISFVLAETGGAIFGQDCDEPASIEDSVCELTYPWLSDVQEVYPGVVVMALIGLALVKRSVRLAHVAFAVGVFLAIPLPLVLSEFLYY